MTSVHTDIDRPRSLDIAALSRDLQSRSPGQTVKPVETHISWVLLCGELAYKLKKPVRLGFLDFGTADARRRACEEEVRLNRRLAPTLYLDVVPVCGTPDAPVIGGAGAPIDHAVRMRRFAEGGLFSEQLTAGTLSAGQVVRLARRIADFHLGVPMAEASSAFGTPELIESSTGHLLAALEEKTGPAALAPLRSWLEGQARALRATFAARRAAGRVREGHGDLHLANAADFEGEVIAFDGIEFDPALRWIDVMSDVSFMVMDLVAHGRSDFAFRFLDVWLERTGDHHGLPVLRYYAVYRALVRALVTALRPGPAPAGGCAAPDYLATAAALAAGSEPRLMITHGSSGSGKTFVSRRVMAQAGAIHLRSDVERKRLFGLGALQHSAASVPGGIYGAEANRRTYDTLLERARLALVAGYPTVVDATFLARHERATFAALAAQLKVPFTILHCHAPDGVLRERVAARQAGGRDASEADVPVLQRQSGMGEPLSDDERVHFIDVDTSAAFDVAAICERWRRGGPAVSPDAPEDARATLSRRRLLLAAAVVSPLVGAATRSIAAAVPRDLSFVHLHTGEKLEVAYFDRGTYRPDALAALNHLLRDFRSGDVGVIDPALFDLLHALRRTTASREPFQVISGFRSSATNETLRLRSSGVASASLHRSGRAIDVRLAGVTLERLRDAARSLQFGGVGYYPRSDFVHVDTGRVRFW